MSKMDNIGSSILTIMWKNKVKFFRVFLFINLFLIILLPYIINKTFFKPNLNLDISNLNTTKFNYFLEVESRRNSVGLLVDLPNCKILNISAWDSAILHLVNETLTPINCDPEKRIWTYVNESDLVLNKSAIINSGFSFKSLSCCFHSIERVEQSQNNFTEYADSTIRFSYNCTKIEAATTPMIHEFIRAICRIEINGISKVVYKKYHIFALSQKSLKTKEKIEYWKKPQQNVLRKPPNVVIIGMDSVSRLSTIRNMPKTRRILKKIGAFEYFGYTKVGENTHPNAIAFLCGYYHSQENMICYLNKTELLDYCPFIWQDFDKSKYFTAEIEDLIHINTFNHHNGFIQQPTDFYYRPFSMAYYYYDDLVNIDLKNNTFKVKRWVTKNHPNYCIGYEKYEKNSLNYIRDLIKMSNKVNVPIFVRSWHVSLAHGDINGAQLGDETFADFFDQLDLNNTVLIFLSDHGSRFGELRNTFPGWLEDKLPTFFIALSQDLKEKYPLWELNLKENSRKLTSPFDLYQTMSDILKITSNTTIPESRTRNGQLLPRKFGQSLITSKVDDSRTCSDAGIPDEYCACLIPNKINLDDPKLKLAAEKSLDHIYSFLPHEFCSKLQLKSIYSGAVLEKSMEQMNYIVSFLAGPGDFKFEANVPYFVANDSFSLNLARIQRVNKINSNVVRCINDSFYKLYCYCLKF